MVVAAYWRALGAGFIWDDDNYVTHNGLLSAPGGLGRLWFTLAAPSQYFPMTYTSFWVERRVWGLAGWGYHGVNIVLHGINAILAWRLLRRLGVPGSWLAAGIFAMHPVNVESVAWISELKNVHSLIFELLTLLAWVEFVEGGKGYWYGAGLMVYGLALASKSTACTLPAGMMLILWLQGRPLGWKRWLQVSPYVLMGLGMGLVSMWWERNQQGTEGKLFELGLAERLMVAGRAVWFYAGKLAWPVGLTFNYPRWEVERWDVLGWGWLAGLMAVGGLIYWQRRRLGRGVVAGLIFYVAMLSPLLGFIMLYTFRYSYVADHYQYVAGLGPMAVVGAVIGGSGWWGQ